MRRFWRWCYQHILQLSFVMFLIMTSVIMVESLIPGRVSSEQSNWVASIFDRGDDALVEILPRSLEADDEVQLYCAETRKIEYHFLPRDTSDQRVRFTLIDGAEFLALTPDGTIKGIKPGRAVIDLVSWRDETLTTSLTVEILPLYPSEIVLEARKDDISVHTSTSLNLHFTPIEAAGFALSYQSLTPDIIEVDEHGIVRGLKAGLGKVQVMVNEVSSNVVNINVNEYPAIPVSSLQYDGHHRYYVGERFNPSLVFNEGASDQTYSILNSDAWQQEDEDIYFEKAGQYQLTFKSNANRDITIDCTLEIIEVRAQGIYFVGERHIRYGETILLEPNYISEVPGLRVSDRLCHFVAEKPEVIRVDDLGHVFGLRKGRSLVYVSLQSNPEVNYEVMVVVSAMEGARYARIHQWVRKFIGHFSLFFITGVFGSFGFYYFLKNKKKIWLFLTGFFMSLLLAVGSETLQAMTPRRYFSLDDILINVLGYLAALVFVCITLKLIENKKRKKLAEPSDQEKQS